MDSNLKQAISTETGERVVARSIEAKVYMAKNHEIMAWFEDLAMEDDSESRG